VPLNKSGKSILKGFQKDYGKGKGERIFFAKMQTSPKQTAKWHGGKR